MKTYVVRMVEQSAVAAVGGFLVAWEASGFDWSRLVLGAAVGAGLRAAYGFLTKKVGDGDQPQMN